MQRQMEMFQDGGLEQDGNTIDPESGNDVPIGSAQEEVRDDIPAQLSEGEFVFPADVVRYIGLEKLMMIRQEAKAGLKRMEEMGQMGNSEEATMPDDIPFNIDDLELADEPVPAYRGGAIQSFATGGSPYADDINVQPGGVAQGQSFGNNLVDLPRIGIPEQPRPVIPPISEDGGYTPPTVADTPVQAPVDPTPPFNVFVPPVADSYKEWVNEDGIVINVPYFRGQILPGYTVPEGFTLKESESVVPEQEGIISDITQEPERDREREIQEAEKAKKDRNSSYDNMISQFLDKNPNASLDEITKAIKGGEGEINLFGKKIKAPGILFDEDMIRRRYNLVQDKYSFPEEDAQTIEEGSDDMSAAAIVEDQQAKIKEDAIKDIAQKQEAQKTRVAKYQAEQKVIEDAKKAEQKAAQAKAWLDSEQEQRQAEAEANRAQAIQDEKDRRVKQREEMNKQRTDINRGDLSREQMFRGINKGGLLNKKPKPKKKKVMKRSGLASKK